MNWISTQISLLQLERMIPNTLFIFTSVVAYIAMYHIGKHVERHQWRKFLEDGERMGKVVREKINKRDAVIQKLKIENEWLKNAYDVVEAQRKVARLIATKTTEALMPDITIETVGQRKEA